MSSFALRTAARLTVSALVAGTMAATAAPASATVPEPAQRSAKQPLSRQLAAARGPVDVLVETTGTTPTSAYAAYRSRGPAAARSAERSAQRLSAVRVASLRTRLAGRGQVIYATTRVLPGVAIHTDASNLRAIAALPGVAAVLPLTAKQRSNARADAVTRAISTWTAQADTGKGATVGVIDTGIDYTHADFGGGGAADFTRNDTTHIPSDDPAYAGDVAFPTAKVVAGYDFAGDAYDGTNAPSPDSDPQDCATSGGGGHGTHVAGTVAGLGVTAAGTAYTGSYAGLTAGDVNAMSIGPGAAPEAKLVALRVFGCHGGTLLTIEALDYVAGLNTDADPSNDVNVLNLSLGSDFTRGDDPDAQAIDAITDLGVLPVVAAGNAGDLYGAVGSPGSARKALTVAATDDGVDTVDAIKLTVDAVDSTYPASNSAGYDYRGNPADKVGELVALTQPDNLDGCSPLDASDAAAVSGKYAFLEWDDADATRLCGSVARSANVKAAGALGAVFGSNAPRFSAGITGDPDIPVTLTNKSGADVIRAALAAGKPVTATFGFSYRAGTANGTKVIDLPSTDKIADFTSRGGTPQDGYLKPDVGAPGLHTFSANSGTGNEGLDESGTSMATPHTAGIAALVVSAHPTWTPEEIKAAVMNTASGVVSTDGHGAGTQYGVTRVGAGRVDALGATAGSVVAFVTSDPGAVGLGFGAVAVTGATSRTKTVMVENFGASDVTYGLSYVSSEDIPGVTFTPSATTVLVPAATPDGRGTATFAVAMTVSSKAALRKTPDPTIALQQADLDRQFLAEENGRLLLAPVGGGMTLRLPVAVAPRPASSMQAASTVHLVRGPHALASARLPLTGSPVSVGVPGAQDAVQSMVGGFQLQASSPALSSCLPTQFDGCLNFPSERAGDLQYVGAAVSDGMLGIALTTRGNVYDPAYNPTANGPVGEIAYIVTIDTDGNGMPDREIDVTRFSPNTDVYVAETYDYVTGALLDDEPLNSLPGSVDTNAINTNAMILPVTLAALGLAADRSRISYTVTTFSLDDLRSTIDTVGPLTFDTAHPAVSVQPQVADSLLSADDPSTALQVRGDAAGSDTDNLGLLLLHLHNTDDSKAQVVGVSSTLDPKLQSYTPLSPVRIGAPSLGSGRVADVAVAGTHGVPAGATAALVSLSTSSASAVSGVTAYPTGAHLPASTVLNTRPGLPTANLVAVPLGLGGKIRLRNAIGNVTVGVDLQGYYTKGLEGSTFVPVAPHRVLDTRRAGGPLAAGTTRDLAPGGVPADATAVALQVTAVAPSAAGRLTVFPRPTGTAVPATVNLALSKGVDTTTMVVSKLSSGSLRLATTGAGSNVVVDLLGWYVPSNGAAFVPVSPVKVLDTRLGLGVAKGKVPAGGIRDLKVAGVGSVPADATSVVINLTGLDAVHRTFFSAYATPLSGSTVPTVTDVNVATGAVTANLAVIPIGRNGSVRFRNAAAPSDLAGYVTGYWTG
jgi:subtilisin family serine protease